MKMKKRMRINSMTNKTKTMATKMKTYYILWVMKFT